MKDLGLILDLNQPLIYEESIVKKSILDFYNPLIRVLKSHKNITVSLNIPLSTLEVLDRCGGFFFISELKELYQNERVEIVNSSPYGVSLCGLSKNVVESQIILNEYGLGYFLGSTKGFEGEPSIMLRDALGFFPANYALDEVALKVLVDFGYSWFAVRGEDIKKDIVEVSTKDSALKAVGVFNDLNKLIYSQKSDGDSGEIVVNAGEDSKGMSVKIDEIIKKYSNEGLDSVVFQLGRPGFVPQNNSDYKDIINNIESILDAFSKGNYSVKSVEEIVKNKSKLKAMELTEFCRNMSKENGEGDSQKKKLMGIDKKIGKIADDRIALMFNSDKKYESSVIKIWDIEEIKTLNDIQLRNNMSFLLFISKILPINEIKQSKLNLDGNEILNNQDYFNSKIDFLISELLTYIDDQEDLVLFKTFL